MRRRSGAIASQSHGALSTRQATARRASGATTSTTGKATNQAVSQAPVHRPASTAVDATLPTASITQVAPGGVGRAFLIDPPSGSIPCAFLDEFCCC